MIVDDVVLGCAIAEKAWSSKRGAMLRGLLAEVASTGAKAVLNIASRTTVTISHAPFTVTISPPPTKPHAG